MNPRATKVTGNVHERRQISELSLAVGETTPPSGCRITASAPSTRGRVHTIGLTTITLMPLAQHSPAGRPPASEICSISFVIPAYNEAAVIAHAVTRLMNRLTPPSVGEHQVLVVDDGSSDGTSRVVGMIARADADGWRVETHRVPTNRGKGYAVRAGLALARHPVVVVVDADVPVDVRALVGLAAAVSESGFHLCIGERKRTTPRSYVRLVAGVVVRAGVRAVFDEPDDVNTCAFALSRDAVTWARSNCQIDSYAFGVELVVGLRRQGWRVTSQPIEWVDRRPLYLGLVWHGIRYLRSLATLRRRTTRSTAAQGTTAGASARLAAASYKPALLTATLR